ncbi:ABC transporter permease [Parachryseolinea silvisoli]|uniref:ABC transporter permease n=1 Tax=Parachryseolinea silvisoli TaxID=2873601 RepID=UPI0022659CE3|nr:ABC transporter permease [Parachryseolinea silvisoli]MCD9014727.1 ABC transporter permease [Parachryseolinea silvisoli]
MMKNRIFIMINIGGMSIALACCIISFLAFEYDATFDTIHKNSESIYRVSAVQTFENELTRVGYAPLPLGEVIDKTIPDVRHTTHYLYSGSNFKRDNDLFAANLTYVDPAFFEMFSFDFMAGNPVDLHDKTSVFVSESMAVRLFRTPSEAFGKTITQVYGGELKEVKIAGIFREPVANSSFYRREGSAYMNIGGFRDEYKDIRVDDWRHETTLYIQIEDETRVAGVQKQLQAYTENNNRVREDFRIHEFVLDPFTTLAYRDRDDQVRAATWAAPPLAAIIGSVIMSMLILLIACFNLTNTAIAISTRRLKEIGLRKVMGSLRIQLIVQFIGETTCICLLALILSLGITDLLIDGWNIMTDNNIHLTNHYLQNPAFVIFLVSILLITGIVAGSYPAFYISRFEPVTILKGKLRFAGTNYFTRTLLGLQFTISLIAVISAVAFMQNARYQRAYDLGFDVRGAVVVPVNDRSEFETYRNALQANSNILAIAGAKTGIFSEHTHEPIRYATLPMEADIIEVGDNYLQAMEVKLLEGRDFRKDSQTDQQESVIITRKLADRFGWAESVGKEILWRDTTRLTVIGVVKDVYTRGLWHEMEPMMIRYIKPDEYKHLVVSADAGNVSSVNTYLANQWNEVFPNRLYPGRMLVSTLQQVDKLNVSIMYSYAFLGTVAMLLSATGLFTLLSLNIIKRTKELGIRKILGASTVSISRIVNTEFVIILLVASLLGAWASAMWTSVIMSAIWKYYQATNIFTYSMGIGLLLIIASLTIGYKSWHLARINPVDTLRDE